MLDLLTPTDHVGAYEWASVFLAHVAIGLALAGLIAAAIDWADNYDLGVSDLAPWVAYFVVWEVIIET